MKIRYVKFCNPIRRGAYSVEPRALKAYRFVSAEDGFPVAGLEFEDEQGKFFVPMSNISVVMLANPE